MRIVDWGLVIADRRTGVEEWWEKSQASPDHSIMAVRIVSRRAPTSESKDFKIIPIIYSTQLRKISRPLLQHNRCLSPYNSSSDLLHSGIIYRTISSMSFFGGQVQSDFWTNWFWEIGMIIFSDFLQLSYSYQKRRHRKHGKYIHFYPRI